jgi:Protein of unknown function (DUF4232)
MHSQANVPACRAEVLDVRLGRSDGAAGTIFYPIIFTNSGPVRCTLTGYPGVSSVDAQGRQIGAPAERVPPSPATTVVLAPHGSASATYGQAQALNYPKSTCRPVTALALRIYAPNETRSRILALKHLACSVHVIGASTVRRVVPGVKG